MKKPETVTAMLLLNLPDPPIPSGRAPLKPAELQELRKKLHEQFRQPVLDAIEKLRKGGHSIEVHHSTSPLPLLNVTAPRDVVDTLSKLPQVRKVTFTVQTRKVEAPETE